MTLNYKEIVQEKFQFYTIAKFPVVIRVIDS